MNLPIVFRRLAVPEHDDAVAWYNEQQPGLGDQLALEIRAALNTAASQPDYYPEVYQGLREVALVRFPFCLYDKVSPGKIDVVAVYHTARDPAGWQTRA